MGLGIDRLYPVIALAILAATTFWLERVTRVPELRDSAEVRADPDFIGEHIHVVSFDEDGRQHYELIAERVVHYPADDVTELDLPRIRYASGQGEVRISAAFGESRLAGEVIFLAGDVQVFRDDAAGGPDMHLASRTLTVWPDEERARSDDPVVLTRGDSIARGDKMKADNLFGTLELIGNTSVFMPPSTRTRQ